MATDLLKTAAEFSVKGPIWSFDFYIGSWHVIISESIVVQWIVMAVLAVVFFILGRNLKVRATSRRQMAAEYLVGFFRNMVRDTMGEKYNKYTAYIGALFCFSILNSLSSLFGFRSPTSDLSVVAAWGLITFVLTQRNKFRTGGVKGFFKGFIEPLPFMLPFNIIGEIANPVSQTLRHFANILAGSVIGGLIYFALGQIANGLGAIGLPAVLSLYFDCFSSFIQAYIFCTLTMAYVSGADCSEE